MRLLAFLTSIESSLRASGLLDSPEACNRSVDYTRGFARMHLDDEQTVVLALHRLASGRTSLRVNLDRAGHQLAVRTLYPESNNFSWQSATDDVVGSMAAFLKPDAEDEAEENPANVVNA